MPDRANSFTVTVCSALLAAQTVQEYAIRSSTSLESKHCSSCANLIFAKTKARNFYQLIYIHRIKPCLPVHKCRYAGALQMLCT